MINLRTLDPTDQAAIGRLVDLLTDHCDVDQVEQFLADLTRWHRGAGSRLQREEARRELDQWQQFVDSLTAVTP
jgi:hypothetical protein